MTRARRGQAEVVQPTDARPLASQHVGFAIEGCRVDVVVAIEGRLERSLRWFRHSDYDPAFAVTRWHALVWLSAPTSAVSTGSATVRHCPSTPAVAAVAVCQCGAAGVEPAAIRDPGGVGGLAREHDRLESFCLRHHREQCLGVGMLRRGHDLLGRAHLEDATEIHHRHPVGDVPGQAEVVGDDDQRQTQFVAQPQQQGEDLAADRRVKARHRLVGDDDLRVEDERSRDHHPLALPAGQFVWVAQVEALGRTQSRTRESVGHLGLLALVQAVYPQALGYRLVHGVPWVECSGRVLQDQLRTPAVGLQIAGPVRQRLACDIDLARGGPLQAKNRAGQCRFPGTAFADQSDDLTAADGEVDTVDRACHITTSDAELDSEVTRFERRRAGFRCCRHTSTSPARWQAASRPP